MWRLKRLELEDLEGFFPGENSRETIFSHLWVGASKMRSTVDGNQKSSSANHLECMKPTRRK